MTTTTAPATFAQVIDAYTDALLDELLAGADMCECCGEPLLAAALNTPVREAWVDVDLRAVHTPHDWARIATLLSHAPMHQIADGRFRADCRSREHAISIARQLRVLGAPGGAITIGGSE